MNDIEMIIASREKDLGGFTVRRLLPYASRRMVGPFIFFDHMGPAEFEPGKGLDVRPHPHINLATVTYLFEGEIRHRDSLGSNQLIRPGDINWMTAGRGIVHSERTPEEPRARGSRMNGIQLWVALPNDVEEVDPSFTHHPSKTLPEFLIGNVHLKLLLGSAYGFQSPVPVHSELFYLEARFPKGEPLLFPATSEMALYVVEGSVRVGDRTIPHCSMGIVKSNTEVNIEALEDSRVMILGGKPVGKRFIFWNFVSSSEDRIENAKQDWLEGPSKESQRFHPIPGDQEEFIPLPESKGEINPKGTIM